MNISKEQIDDINVVVSVQIGNDDYSSKVSEVLRDYRRKANMPGFRPGKVPEGVIRKMYGKAILIDEVNKLVSETLTNYIKEEQWHVLGDPMPKISGDEFDWEIGNDFTFVFDMGLAPEIQINMSKEDQIVKYKITVEQDSINSAIEHHTRRYGQYVDADSVVDFSEKLKGDIVQLDENGQPLSEGFSVEDATLLVSLIKDDELKKPFENVKTGDEIVFNLSKTFSNEWEIASILKIKKDEIGDISESLFKFIVKSISRFENAEVNQELFDKVFGEGAVSTREEFEKRISENIAADLEYNSGEKLKNDCRDYFLKKFNPQLPEEFLRNWLKFVNQEIDEETFEKEFPMFLENMKWELIVSAIAKQYELKVEEEEIIEYAKVATRRQFAMYYGNTDIPEKEIANFAMNYLKEEKNVRGTVSKIVENKAFDIIIENIDLSIQEVSLQEFENKAYPKHTDDEKAVNETEEASVSEEDTVNEIKEATEPVENVEIAESDEIAKNEDL